MGQSVFHGFFLAVWPASAPCRLVHHHLLFISRQRSGLSAILLMMARETRQHLGAFLGTSSLAWTRFLFTVWQRCSVCCVVHGIRKGRKPADITLQGGSRDLRMIATFSRLVDPSASSELSHCVTAQSEAKQQIIDAKGAISTQSPVGSRVDTCEVYS